MSLLRRVIGGVLRRVRLRQGRTLREVAQAAGVSLPYLSEVERGRKEASSEVLAAICRALGINLSDLLEQARDELRRVEPRVPTTPRASLARLERLPVAQPDGAAPTVQLGPRTAGPLLRLGAPAAGSLPHVAPPAAGPLPYARPSAIGSGLRVWLTPPEPAGTPARLRSRPGRPGGARSSSTSSGGPRTARALARKRALAGRRRLTSV
jgi:transcriptional regulator with XRE-family HTH domain